MKKSIPYLLVLMVLVLGMTGQSYIQTCGKVCTNGLTFSKGETDAETETIVLNGKCSQVEVEVSADTSNNITFTVAVTTSDGGTLFSKAAIADNGSTILKATSDATDFDAFLAAEKVTVTITPSGDSGDTGATVYVGFYLE